MKLSDSVFFMGPLYYLTGSVTPLQAFPVFSNREICPVFWNTGESAKQGARLSKVQLTRVWTTAAAIPAALTQPSFPECPFWRGFTHINKDLRVSGWCLLRVKAFPLHWVLTCTAPAVRGTPGSEMEEPPLTQQDTSVAPWPACFCSNAPHTQVKTFPTHTTACRYWRLPSQHPGLQWFRNNFSFYLPLKHRAELLGALMCHLLSLAL